MLSGQGKEEDWNRGKMFHRLYFYALSGGEKVKSHAQTVQHVKHLSLSTDTHSLAALTGGI